MAQLDLFGKSQLRVSVPQRPDLSAIRLRLVQVLEELKGATQIPWAPTQLKSWQHVFYNMANWLPADERDDFRQRFTQELSRLNKEKPLEKTG
jgi:hypothetical protein